MTDGPLRTLPLRSSPLPAALLCLLLSGAGSLTLEIVWSRWLRLVFGSTTVAITTTLVAYMTGLGFGGLVGARWARRLQNGLRAYGLAELALGAYALAMPLLLLAYPAIDHALSAPGRGGLSGIGRFLAALAVLLLPTLLMGASLPLVTRALEGDGTPRPGLIGLVYGVNTLGAVLGVLLASFVALPLLGLRWTNTLGAALDVVAGAIAFLLLAPRHAGAPSPSAATERTRRVLPTAGGALFLLGSYALVGASALADEVAWTRALSMIFGSSVHSFAVMLAAFLTGIVLGSLVARKHGERLRDPLGAYGLVCIAAGALSFGTLLSFRFLPDLMLALLPALGLVGRNVVVAGLVVSLVAMLGPTLLFGALFPLAARALRPSVASESAAIGAVSFANTLGSALGALSTGFLLVPWLGLPRTMSLSAAALAGIGAVVLLTRGGARRAAGVVVAIGAVAAVSVPTGWDEARITAGEYYHIDTTLDMGLPYEELEGVPAARLLYYRDGMEATISVQERGAARNLRINGKVEASTSDRVTQLSFGHLPMLFGPKPERILAIGYASGDSIGAITLHEPARIDVVEIEPTVIEASRFFDEYNRRPLDNPRVKLILDDARHVLAVTDEKYDVIMSEPSHPFLSGAASLFTAEFFRAAHRALSPSGRLVQWVQLYGLDEDTLRSIFATITDEFPHVYGFLDQARAADLLLYASDRPLVRDEIASWEALPAAVRRELQRLRIESQSDLESLLRLTEDVRELGRGAVRRNTDDSMYVEIRGLRSLYRNQAANRSFLASGAGRGALDVLDQGPTAATSAAVGRLALSYYALRQENALAERLTEEAARRGTSAPQLAAAASLLLGQEDPALEPRAMEILDRAVALDPRDFDARFIRAVVHSRARRDAAALADLEAALAERPEHLRARRLCVRTWVALGQGDRALAEARALAATALADLEPQIHSELGVLEATFGDPAAGRAEVERAIAIEPQNPEGWRRLAVVARRSGDAQTVERAERNAERAAHNVLILRHRLARLTWAHGDRENARKLLRSLVEEHPDYRPAAADLERYGS